MRLNARVNRSFKTSMEVGVTVNIDVDPTPIHVCKAFFTFVEVCAIAY